MKKFFTSLIIMSLFFNAKGQTPNSWQLYLNKQKISIGIIGKPSTAEIPKNKIGDLKLKVFGDTSVNAFKKTIVVVDTAGKELLRENFTAAQITFHINEKEFIAKYGQIPFIIHCIQVPIDIKNIRFVPKRQMICAVYWR